MGAPDKVYVKKEKNNVVYSLSVQYDNGGEVYIRKDALVERINKQILFYQNSVPVNDYEDGCNKGAIAALEHVVKSL